MPPNPYQPPKSNALESGVLRKPYALPVGLSFVAYIVSFFLPVFDSGTPQVMYGYQAFVLAIFSQFLPCWLANPIYWLACHRSQTGNTKSARNYAISAVTLSASQIWMMNDTPEVGFYLWVASMGVLAVPLTVNQPYEAWKSNSRSSSVDPPIRLVHPQLNEESRR